MPVVRAMQLCLVFSSMLSVDAWTQVELAWEEVARPFVEKHKDLKVFPQGDCKP
jgi:hypothetical protein